MKFFVAGKAPEPDEPINVTTVVDHDGDVEVNANGVILLWITTDGKVLMCNDTRLSDMGFKTNQYWRVRIAGIDE